MRTAIRGCSRRVLVLVLLIGIATSGASGNETSPGTNPISGSFEKTETQANALANWTVFSEEPGHIGAVSDRARTGKQSLRIEALKEPKAYQAVVKEIQINDEEKYTFTVYAINDRGNPLKGDIEAQLVIEWKDEYDQEVGRDWTKRWGRSLSRLRWEKYELRNCHPPKRAVKAIVGVHVFEGMHGGKGVFYVDDLTASAR